MKQFGEDWDVVTAEEMKALPDFAKTLGLHEDGNAGGPSMQEKVVKWLPLTLTGIIAIAAIIAITVQSGGTVSPARPKAVLFIVEGLKATVFQSDVVQGYRGPNMRAIAESGTYSGCMGTSDSRCCRAQGGPKFGAQWTAAPGITSIITGVNVNKHGVTNTSYEGMRPFAQTSKQYPSIMSILLSKGLKTTAWGAGSFLTAIDDTTGRCTNYGVADFECDLSNVVRCTSSTTCNLFRRYSQLTSGGAEVEEDIADAVEKAIEGDNSDLLIVHLNRLNLAATTQPGGDFTGASVPYAAQLYRTDAVIGIVTSLLRSRALLRRENWLVMGVSDHEGLQSTSGFTPDHDEVVAFFMSTVTPMGALQLSQPTLPSTQMDVVPTLLTWFGLMNDGFRSYLDGQVQGICTSGAQPTNCTSNGGM